jgi:hypothetical protein
MDDVACVLEEDGGRIEGLRTVPGTWDNNEFWFGSHYGSLLRRACAVMFG